MKYLPLTLAAIAASALLSTACQSVDESAPTHPRTSLLPTDPKSQDNAEKRALEPTKPQMPTAGPEFPGQSDARPVHSSDAVVTLDDASAASVAPAAPASSPPAPPSAYNNFFDKFGHRARANNVEHYPGPMPHLPANPGTIPMPGTTPVPDSPWTIDNSWGQGLQLQDYPHRPWPDTTAYYKAAQVRNNPTYAWDIRPELPVQQNNGTYRGEMKSAFYEVPWFYLNSAALPVLMVLEPPDTVLITNRLGGDPMYFGYLPANGPIVPTPSPSAAATTSPALPPSSQPATLPE